MGRLSKVGVLLGVACAATSTMSLGGPVQAAAGEEYYAHIEGQYATIEGSLGSSLLGNLFSGQLSFMVGETKLDSRGVDTINGFDAPTGAMAASRGEFGLGRLAGVPLSSDHIISTAPVSSGPASKTYVPVPVPPLLSIGLISGVSSAKWNGLFTRNAPGQQATEIYGDTAYVDFLDLGDSIGGALGPAANLLPTQLDSSLISLQTVRAHAKTLTTRNSDGTHGLRAEGVGGLAAIHILGGSDKGGVTLGLFNSDTGNNTDTAGTRIWATGKPGGAGCSYTVPDTLQVTMGGNKIGLPLSVGQRVTLPAGLGYLDFRFAGQSHCETSPDGTYAHATGAGLGFSLHLTMPSIGGVGGGDLGVVTMTLPDLDQATVKVPKGGIPPTDGGGNQSGSTTANATGNASGSATGTTTGNATGSTQGNQSGNASGNAAGSTDGSANGDHSGATAGVSGVLPDTGGVWRMLAPIALVLVLVGHVLMRRGRVSATPIGT